MDWKALVIHESGKINDISVTDRLARFLLGLDGGPGSGNHNHSGRPGKVGGSAPKDSGNAESGEKSPKLKESSTNYEDLVPADVDENFDIFEYLGKSAEEEKRKKEEEAKKNEPAYAESAKRAMEGIRQSFHMQGVLKAAREAKGDYKAFVKNMTQGQQDALREQYQATGSKEHFTDYVKRMQKMLADEKDPPPPQNKPVTGGNIALTYEYKGRESATTDGSEAIDTIIEDVIHQQGFDGVPKVVTKEEFNKIIREHPEMPILMRSFSAPNAEVMDKYNQQLEGGFWYVDCNVGGAQYGQGMYTAGVYRHGARDATDAISMIDWRNKFATDKYGRIFKLDTLDFFSPSSVADMQNGDRAVLIHEDTSDASKSYSILVEAVDSDEFGILLGDMNTGEFLSEEEIRRFDEIRYVDDEVTEKGMMKEQLKYAMVEMRHYRESGEGRFTGVGDYGQAAFSNMQFSPEEAYEKEIWDGNMKRYKPVGELKKYDPSELNPGDTVLLYVKYYEDDEKRTIMCAKVREDGSLDFGPAFKEDRVNRMLSEKPVEMRKAVMVEDRSPKSSTRMMTLDPSAKIIDYSRLVDIMEGRMSNEEVDDLADKWFEKNFDGSGMTDEEKTFIRFAYSNTFGMKKEEDEIYMPKYKAVSEMFSEEEQEYLKQKASHLRNQFDNSADLFEASHEAVQRGKEYRRRFNDPGALAAALGYDAINSEGHGMTDSYTVVLNRTKVILSDELVDVA